MARRAHRHRVKVPAKLERMYKHVLESYLDRGYSLKTATARAAATVNKYRSKLARGVRSCRKVRGRRTCHTRRGPQLVTRGGSRRQWYPGKGRATGRREKFVCLKHDRRFKTKAALLAHYKRHRRV